MKFKVAALLREFPEIGRNASLELVDDASVARITLELLEYHPRNVDWQAAGEEEIVREYFRLCHSDGTPFGGMGSQSVGERIACADQEISLLVKETYEHRKRSDGSVTEHRGLTVYKPPKGWSVQRWAEEQRRRAYDRLQAEIAEIDAEGQ